jgi:hypothetical protein
MTAKMIFLSHIHEESELAILIKSAIEDEFSGFVEVFVSSDGTSIASGANFLKKIESALVSCTAAIYLISPISVKRSWVNFELGAIWIRSAIQERSGQPEIPLIPVCHSGMSPSELPSPINNLNAISGTDAASLERAFKSIQAAMGGKGRLKTDFDELSSKIGAIQERYTMGDNLRSFFELLMGENVKPMIKHFKGVYGPDKIKIDIDGVDTDNFKKAQSILQKIQHLGITLTSESLSLVVGKTGSNWVDKAHIEMLKSTLLKFETDLIGK